MFAVHGTHQKLKTHETIGFNAGEHKLSNSKLASKAMKEIGASVIEQTFARVQKVLGLDTTDLTICLPEAIKTLNQNLMSIRPKMPRSLNLIVRTLEKYARLAYMSADAVIQKCSDAMGFGGVKLFKLEVNWPRCPHILSEKRIA